MTDSNIAETVAREARKPVTLSSSDGITHVALPQGFSLETIDNEKLLTHPRRKIGSASLNDVESLLAFVARHRTDSTVVWCLFDPVQAQLRFQAVIDDHAASSAGWRGLSASYTPALSVEFQRWSGQDMKSMGQVDFAEWIERNQDDIASVEGRPSSLAMLKMATEFEANADKRLKSTVRLQSGGSRFEFVDEDRQETIERMEAFNMFALGLPVYRNGAAFRIDARLRYRNNSGKLSFSYELLRSDKVVEAAGLDVIAKVRAGLGDDTPLVMGGFSK